MMLSVAVTYAHWHRKEKVGFFSYVDLSCNTWLCAWFLRLSNEKDLKGKREETNNVILSRGGTS